MTTRRVLNLARILLVGVVAITLLVLLVNLSWFDEPLHPELESLRTSQPVSMDDNSYPMLLGFRAADDRDPRRVGEEILQALHERYEQRQRISLSGEEMAAILGGSNLGDTWRADFTSLDCVARVYLDCADQIIADVVQGDSQSSRLSVLLERYETILRQEHFLETQQRDLYSPSAPYRLIAGVGRLRLAISIQRDSTEEFLRKASEDLEFWRTMLREGETLGAKMVSIQGIQNDLDFLSALMRTRSLTGSNFQSIRRFLRPFTREESDIGEAFLSEARMVLLSEVDPVVMNSSWVTRLMLQDNATLNEMYLTTTLPVRDLASLSAREYFDQEAYKPLNYYLRAFPPPLYNLGGKLARRRSAWSPELFPARVHDENGRISLVLLQADIEQSSRSDVEVVIRSSIHRNPYTDEPMEYDAEAQTIGFECLHTVYHPPALPDDCSVFIGHTAN